MKNFRKQYLILLVIIVWLKPGFSQDKLTIAVLDFESYGISEYEVQSLTNRTRTLLVRNGKYQVVERGKMDEILNEQGFQQSGCTSEECIVEVGQLLGVKLMLAGSIGLVGSTYTIDLRIINVENSKIYKTASHDIKGQIDDVLSRGLGEALDKLLEEKPEEKVPDAMLTILSNPIQAQVFIDGQTKGLTPMRLLDLPPNSTVEIMIQKENYETYSETRELKPGANPSVNVQLAILKGKVSVNGQPDGAIIRINNEKIGKTPIEEFTYPVGEYELIVSKPEFYHYQNTVAISNATPARVSYVLKKQPKGKPLLLSFAVPGLGQMTQRRKIRGLLFLSTAAGLGYLAYDAQLNYSECYDDWEQKKNIYNNNLTHPELWDSQRQAVIDAYDLLKDAETQRLLMTGGLGVVWSVNILDIIF